MNSPVLTRTDCHAPLSRIGSRLRPLAAGCAALLGMGAAALAQNTTGQFSAAFLGTGDIDTQVGLTTAKEYLYAYNLGSTNSVSVNGVNFTGVGGTNPTVAGQFSTTGMGNVFGSGAPNPGGQLGAMMTDFVYGAGLTAEVFTFNGLTVGESYVITFYNASWDPETTGRRQTMSAGGASVVGAGAYTFDMDIGATGQGQFTMLRYTFLATTNTQTINFTPQVNAFTMHNYAFSAERTFNNTYVSGADWTTATWGAAGVPNARGRSAAFGTAAVPTTVNLDSDITIGHLQFDSANAYTLSSATGRTLTLQADVSGISTLSAKSGTHVVEPNITLLNNLLKVGAGAVTLNGNITGGNSGIHLSGGTLRLAGTNTYTGETLINGGVLEVTTLSDYGVPSAIGSRTLAQENTTVTGVSLHLQNGTLRFVGSTPQSTNRHIRILNGATGGTLDASGTTPSATMSFTRSGAPINLFDTGGVRTLTLTGTNTGDNTLGLQIINQGANATSIAKTGAGTWAIGGPDNNTATGATSVTNGTLKLAKTNATAVSGALTVGNGSAPVIVQLTGTGGNQIANTSLVTIGGTGGNAGRFQLNNLSETIGGLVSTGGAGIVENESGAAGTGTLTLSVAGTQTFSGVLRDGDGTGTDGILALTKIGAGTQTLSGANTYTGATTVTAGTLNLTGSIVSTAGVSGTGILGGTGTIQNTVTTSAGGRVSPATATTGGTLSMSGLVFGSGSFADLEFGGTNDLINVTGAGGLALNGGAVNVFATGGVTPLTANGSYTLFDYVTNYTGALNSLTVANAQAGKFYTLNDDTTNTLLQLVVTDAATTEWNGLAGTGLWGDDGNWTATQANSPGAVARFGTIPVAPTSVSVVGTKTVGNILFDNTNSYTLSGSSISLDNGIGAAVISVTSGNHSIGNALALSGNLNATVAASTTLTLAGDITGSRNLTKLGTGTLILTGANSYAATALTAGTLQVGNGGNTGTLGAGDVSMAAGTQLTFNRLDDITVANNITGSGTLFKTGGTVTLTGANSFSTVNISAGTLKLGSATAIGSGATLTINGMLDLGDLSPTVAGLSGGTGTVTTSGTTAGTSTLVVNQTATLSFDGTIVDGPTRLVALEKTGTGILTLAGTSSNTYQGLTTVTHGTLRLAKPGATAVAGNVVIGDTAGSDVLELGAADQIANTSVITLNSGGSGNSAFLRINGFNETVKGLTTTVGALGVVENNAAAGGTAILTVDTAGVDFTYDGIVRNASAGASIFGLTKTGAGTLTLMNTAAGSANGYSGPTAINNGRLLLENPGGIGATVVTITSGTPGAYTINTATRDLNHTGAISGTGELVKNGLFTLTLRGTGGFSGKTIVNAGTVGLGGVDVLGTSEIVMNGGILRAVDAGRVLTNPVTVNASFTLGRLTDLLGPITLNADATISANNFDGPANNPSNLGPIGGNFRISFAEGPQGIGTGSLNVTGINSNAGGTAVLSGRVNVNGGGALSLGPLIVNGGELNMNHSTQSVESLSGTGGVVNLSAVHTLTVNQSVDTTFAGGIGGAGALVKAGTGNLTLTGTNTHGGSTTVDGGTLTIAGTMSGTFSVSVNTGGVLAGGGSIVGLNTSVTIVSGGKLSPGPANPLTMNLGGGTLDLTGAVTDFPGSLLFDVGATVDAVLMPTGSLNIGAGVLAFDDFAFTNGGGLQNGVYTLFDTGVPITGFLDPIAANLTGSLGGDQTGTLGLGDNGQDVILTVVPEPGSAVLLLGGLGLLAGRRRRRG